MNQGKARIIYGVWIWVFTLLFLTLTELESATWTQHQTTGDIPSNRLLFSLFLIFR